uniref:(California timema) hypothetical protein n=1 Tax=Timema californicum TaxID=61474 RepID=A0A7R9P6J0_TIMCA|nr:unnamed protein product [Timema californicum]
MVTGGIVTILDSELMVTGGIVTIMDSELMVTGGIVTILDRELMVTGGIVTIMDSELMVTGGIVTILDSELMVTGGIVTILDSELMVTGGIVTIMADEQCLNDQSMACSCVQSLAGPVLLQDLKRMEDKKTGRLVGSKVSQIANIFQSMVPAKEAAAEVILAVPLRHPQATSPTSPKAERRRTVGGGDELRDSPTQVTVVRTESHVARFNNARALFEKLGSEDNRAASKPPPPVVAPTSKQVPLRSRSSSDNSSAGTSPVRMASRSPSPRPLGGSVSSQPVNGHQANGLSSATDDDSGGGPTPTKTSPTTNVEWLKQTRPSRQQTANVAKPNGVVRGVVDVPPVVRQLPVGLRPKPEKPEKPERKFNSRELIEKQRNWTSHFSKSRSAPRYNSDPNRSEVRVGVVGGKPKQTADTAATRSASFNATRPLRSPAVSPPPPPVRAPSRSPSRSPSSVSEDKLEKEPMEKTCKGVASSPSRSSDSSSPLSEDRRPQYLSSQENLSRGPSPSSPGELRIDCVGHLSWVTSVVFLLSLKGGVGGLSQLNPSHEVSLVQDVVGCVCARFVAAVLVSCQEEHTLLPIVNFDEDDYNGHCVRRSPGNRDSLPGDAEKRLREEDLEEVRTDVAHVSKRKKMVSSVQLTLQDPHQQSGGVITNSVLRELEDRTSDPAPAHSLLLSCSFIPHPHLRCVYGIATYQENPRSRKTGDLCVCVVGGGGAGEGGTGKTHGFCKI